MIVITCPRFLFESILQSLDNTANCPSAINRIARFDITRKVQIWIVYLPNVPTCIAAYGLRSSSIRTVTGDSLRAIRGPIHVSISLDFTDFPLTNTTTIISRICVLPGLLNARSIRLLMRRASTSLLVDRPPQFYRHNEWKKSMCESANFVTHDNKLPLSEFKPVFLELLNPNWSGCKCTSKCINYLKNCKRCAEVSIKTKHRKYLQNAVDAQLAAFPASCTHAEQSIGIVCEAE